MVASFSFDISFCKCLFSSFESLRGHFPLADATVLFVDPFLITLLLCEPLGILRFLHDDLNSSALLVQIIVNGVYELLRCISGLFLNRAVSAVITVLVYRKFAASS